MLTKNTTHQYTPAEMNQFSPAIDPELPTEFQIGNDARRNTSLDDDHEEEMDFSNFMQKSFKNAESEQELDEQPDFGLGQVLSYRT